MQTLDGRSLFLGHLTDTVKFNSTGSVANAGLGAAPSRKGPPFSDARGRKYELRSYRPIPTEFKQEQSAFEMPTLLNCQEPFSAIANSPPADALPVLEVPALAHAHSPHHEPGRHARL